MLKLVNYTNTMKQVKLFGIVVVQLAILSPPVFAEILVAQANQRMSLAKEIKSEAFEFAGDLGNYSRVERLSDLSWRLISASDQKASCAVAAKDIITDSFNLNLTYQSALNIQGNAAASGVEAMMAQQINVAKRKIASSLDKIDQFCN